MINAAIVGIGRWGQGLVSSVQGSSDQIRFTAGVTRTRAKAEEYCADNKIDLRDDYAELLADASLDAIVLATPHTQHEEQIVAAAHDRMLQLVEEINDLKSQRAQTLAELRSTIQTHAKLLEITENQLAARDTLDNQQRFMHSRGNDGTP